MAALGDGPEVTPRVREVLAGLQAKMATRFPDATFAVDLGYDPDGVYRVPTVDVDDSFEVVDLIGDRLLGLQVDEGLPLYLAVLRPPERDAQIRRAG